MIPDNMFNIRLLKRPHKFFVYWIGRPDYHIMDWAGCNFHWVRAESQPKGGFDTPWEAWMWADKRQVLQKQEVQDELARKSGSHKSDSKEYFEASLNHRYVDDYVEFRVECPLSCKEHDRVCYNPPEEWVKEYLKWLEERRLIWTKIRACEMRRQGYRIVDIARIVKQPRTKVSRWTKDVKPR